MKRLNTYTGLWRLIDTVIDRIAAVSRRAEQRKAREREIAAARERLRRENSAAAFDARMARRRGSLVVAMAAAVFSWPASSQVRVSFQQQGAEVLKTVSGKRLKGVGIARVAACNLAPVGFPVRDLDAELVYSEAGRLGISTIAPVLAGPILDHSVATSFSQFLVDLATGGSSLVGILGLSNKIKMPTWAAELLTAVPAVFLLFKSFFTKRVANDQPVKNNLLDGVYPLAPGRCIPSGRVLLFRYSGDWPPREATIP